MNTVCKLNTGLLAALQRRQQNSYAFPLTHWLMSAYTGNSVQSEATAFHTLILLVTYQWVQSEPSCRQWHQTLLLTAASLVIGLHCVLMPGAGSLYAQSINVPVARAVNDHLPKVVYRLTEAACSSRPQQRGHFASIAMDIPRLHGTPDSALASSS